MQPGAAVMLLFAPSPEESSVDPGCDHIQCCASLPHGGSGKQSAVKTLHVTGLLLSVSDALR